MSFDKIQDPAVREALSVIKDTVDRLVNILQDPIEGHSAIIKSCLNSESSITKLRNEITINCKKLDSMKENTDMIPSILEIVTGNGQGIEVISERVDKLEK